MQARVFCTTPSRVRPCVGRACVVLLLTALVVGGDAASLDRGAGLLTVAEATASNTLTTSPGLARIVWLWEDVSAIGGIPTQLRNVAGHAADPPRPVQHCIAVRTNHGPRPAGLPCLLVQADDPAGFLEQLRGWAAAGDTVAVAPNLVVGGFDAPTQAVLTSLPLVHMGAGQMSYNVLHGGRTLVRSRLWQTLRASGILSFSRGDINFQRQLGIFGQVRTFPPVAQRPVNTFDPARNVHAGYVGRSNFATKAVDRLVDVARVLQQRGLPPLKVFTTNGTGVGSPDFDAFMAMLARAGVADHVDVVVNCVDKDAMFGGLKVLVLPSRMEASSNAALEAFSRGVPVIAARHAAGPADLITHCRNGLLLDEWDADAAVDGIESLAGPRLRAMSAAAFDKHKLYTMDAHLAVVERVAGEALARFHASNRTNVLPVFPRLQWDRSAGMQDGARREACRAPPSTTTPPIAGAPRPAGQPPAPSLKLSASTRRQRRLMARSQPETTAPGSGGVFIVTTHRARAHRRAHAKPHVHWPRASGRANDSVCERIGRVDDALPSPSPTGPHLRRIVMMVPDLSDIGGQETRVRNLVTHARHSSGRGVEYVALTRRNRRNATLAAGMLSFDRDEAAVREAVRSKWSPRDTVIVATCTALRPGSFPADVLAAIASFPLLYVHSAQLAYVMQNYNLFRDAPDYVRDARASGLMSFSKGDIEFQQQLGVYGQARSFPPVATRPRNEYDPSTTNTHLGYVGRLSFEAKGADLLIDVARALQARRERAVSAGGAAATALPALPIQVYTTSSRSGSPDLDAFLRTVQTHNLSHAFNITLDCRDKDAMFGGLRALLLPSRKEASSNAGLEAFSYGVPIIAASYAPGPADLVQHGVTGYLLDDYTSAAVVDCLEKMGGPALAAMSARAFARHTHFSMDAHMRDLEREAWRALERFEAAGGRNAMPIFPAVRA